MAQTHQFCTFYLDKLMFGVELEKVQEVIRFLEITEIPLAPQGRQRPHESPRANRYGN